jgi:hypothetical protein
MVSGLAKLPTQGEHPAQTPSGTHAHRPKQVLARFERNYGAQRNYTWATILKAKKRT